MKGCGSRLILKQRKIVHWKWAIVYILFLKNALNGGWNLFYSCARVKNRTEYILQCGKQFVVAVSFVLLCPTMSATLSANHK